MIAKIQQFSQAPWNPENGEIVPDAQGRRFITVFISWNPELELQNYRCNNCGKLVFVYGEGSIYMVFDAKIVRHQLFTDYTCSNNKCGIVYRVYAKS